MTSSSSSSSSSSTSSSSIAQNYKRVGKGPLPDDFQPNSWTILCGKGKDYFDHVGNRRFRVLVSCHVERYAAASTKVAKSDIVTEIIASVRNAGGCFAKFHQKDGRWYECGDALAREKVGGIFRDSLHTQYKSAAKTKRARWKAEQGSSLDTLDTDATESTFDSSSSIYSSTDTIEVKNLSSASAAAPVAEEEISLEEAVVQHRQSRQNNPQQQGDRNGRSNASDEALLEDEDDDNVDKMMNASLLSHMSISASSGMDYMENSFGSLSISVGV